jgi:DNA repair exonuclease SbcCD ATPase subunit
LKKQKGKKAPAKKKEDKTEVEAEASAAVPAEETKDEPAPEADADEAVDDSSTSPANARPSHGRQPSVSVQSKLRSESFRKSSGNQTPTSPTLKSPILPSLNSSEGAQEVFKKQASRIDELEKENKRLHTESQDAQSRWRKLEEELQELREASSDAVELKSKAEQADKTVQELDKLVSSWAALLHAPILQGHRNQKSPLYNARTPSFNPPHPADEQLPYPLILVAPMT